MLREKFGVPKNVETFYEKEDRLYRRRQALEESLKIIYVRQLNYDEVSEDDCKRHLLPFSKSALASP